jgi:uncharacterized membrane protein
VSRYDWILFLHVLSSFAVVAAVVVYTFLIVVSRNLDTPSDVVRAFRITRVGDALVSVGMGGVLVFGIWLALDVDGYALWDGWIIAALVLWAVFGAVGGRTGKVYNAARDRARTLVAEGRDAPNAELNALLRSQTGLVLQLLSIVIVLLLLLDMIFKPGA